MTAPLRRCMTASTHAASWGTSVRLCCSSADASTSLNSVWSDSRLYSLLVELKRSEDQWFQTDFKLPASHLVTGWKAASRLMLAHLQVINMHRPWETNRMNKQKEKAACNHSGEMKLNPSSQHTHNDLTKMSDWSFNIKTINKCWWVEGLTRLPEHHRTQV